MMALRSKVRSLDGGIVAASLAVVLLACSADGIVGEGELPPEVLDPEVVDTPAGAIAAYRDAIIQFRSAADVVTVTGGLLADELTLSVEPVGVANHPLMTRIDTRQLPELDDQQGPAEFLYRDLQRLRGQTRQARGLLAVHAPGTSPALRGHLYAVEAYAELYLADLYCSGIPLSTVDFGGDYTLAGPSRSVDVYGHALALLDTALTMVGDSARLVHLTQVGRGRTLLALGRYAEAGAAVAEVPDGFQYDWIYQADVEPRPAVRQYAEDFAGGGITPTMADREGHNGLDYLSSGDPRTAFELVGQNRYGFNVFLPSKYLLSDPLRVVIADAIEARLIEAEAALQAGDVVGWLARINALRQTAMVPALPDTTDPGTDAARLDLLFRERAFWLYLGGYRQGDLRRLVRDYGRDPDTVYPTGREYQGGVGAYGRDVTLPVPMAEQLYNSNYTGCIHRNA